MLETGLRDSTLLASLTNIDRIGIDPGPPTVSDLKLDLHAVDPGLMNGKGPSLTFICKKRFAIPYHFNLCVKGCLDLKLQTRE